MDLMAWKGGQYFKQLYQRVAGQRYRGREERSTRGKLNDLAVGLAASVLPQMNLR